MKFLKRLDDILFKAVQVCLGIFMIALTAIVVLQVLVRYVFHVSIGGVEELPVYLMLLSVWIAAIFVARDDGHVKIELLDMFVKKQTHRRPDQHCPVRPQRRGSGLVWLAVPAVHV